MAAVATVQARPTWVRWRIVLLLMSFSFMSWFNRVSIPVADDEIMAGFCLSPTQIGTISSAFFWAYMLCMTPGGWLIDRYGPRRALIVMGFGSALFGALTAVGGSAAFAASLAFASFLLIRALMGAFTAPIYPASGRVVSHWIAFPRRAWANGLITGAAPLGIAFSHVLFGALIDEIGWRAAFILTGAITAVLAVLWTDYATDYPAQHPSANAAERQFIEKSEVLRPAGHVEPPTEPAHLPAEELPPPPGPVPTSPWWLLLHNRSLILLTLSYAAVGYFEYLCFFWTEYYFKTVLRLGVERGRWYAFIASLAMVVTMPGGGWLSDRLVRAFGHRLGRALVPAGGMVLSALTLYGVGLTHDVTAAVILFTLAHGAIGATEGSFWTTAIELGGRRGGTSAGICNTGGNAGGALAPMTTPWIATTLGLGWGWSLNVSCVICLVGACLWWWIDPSERGSKEQ
jgi:MFS family permease